MKKYKNQKNITINIKKVIFLCFITVLTFFIFIVPSKVGVIGRTFYVILFFLFGTTSYVLPFIFSWFCFIHVIKNPQSVLTLIGKFDFIWSTIWLILLSVFIESIHFIFKLRIYGGIIGLKLFTFLKELFGIWFVFFVIITALIILCIKFLKNLNKFFIQKPQNNFEITHPNPKLSSKILKRNQQEKYLTSSNAVSKKNINNIKYELPSVNLLHNVPLQSFTKNKSLRMATLLKKTLADFNIRAEIQNIIHGPIVTRYDLVLAPGTRIQSIVNISDNISLIMRTSSIRIIPIPEKAVVGIEVSNHSKIFVRLKEIFESSVFKNSESLLTLALGKTIDGFTYVTNLTLMPHILIAGATGTGKSMALHAIILSILYKARPDEVKFILIDPKRVEMTIYKNIPHLYNPCVKADLANVITSPKEAVMVLKKLVKVMEERYVKFSKVMAKNIEIYNNKMAKNSGDKEFYIVVIIDELSDLILTMRKEIECYIQRLAQMSRAVGIHLILATQRPSVNVITGVIKANFPSRLSLKTTSKIDSRIILDTLGAESLIGNGDMLFLPTGKTQPIHLQGVYISSAEIDDIISFINNQNFPNSYNVIIEHNMKNNFDDNEKITKDLIFSLKLINERKRISQDLLRANLGSSAKATNILSILETKGFVFKPNGMNKWCINFDKVKAFLSKL
ncbi:MAG: DNA translocase FtsK [Endomicrobium sp.]|nr:DNA translocase FtsK [Endomicrobium sp.]